MYPQWVQNRDMSSRKLRSRSRAMAPPSKGHRSETKVRVPTLVRAAMQKLAALHAHSENEEMVAAFVEHIANHDPATCQNTWCVAARMKKKRD
jgi:hypothetical protein